MNRQMPLHRRLQQRGAATLVVVMVLFFLMLLVSAYAGRTLIFEQRTSANQYRAAQAYEAAAGGLEWALAMLNSGQRINEACEPTTNPLDNTFRDRYLSMELDTGKVNPTTPSSGLFAACVHGAEGWRCQCPIGSSPTLGTSTDAGATFMLEMRPLSAFAPAGPIAITSWGCSTSNDSRCFPGGAISNDATATHTMRVALVSALQQPPTAALTSPGEVVVPAGMTVVNQVPGGSAVAIRSGANIVGTGLPSALALPAGVPADDGLVRNDPQIAALSIRLFVRHSGLSEGVFRGLPSTAACLGNSCEDTLLNAAANGRRLLYAGGDLTLPPNTSLGSPEQPVMLVVQGTLTLQGLTNITGLVYTDQLNWVNGASAAFVRGGTLVRGSCCLGISGSPSLIYDRDVLRRLQLGAGAYARVPGSWQDK